ncbi:Nif3-like dinuclear metal center hexameric protein [Litorivicinus lipolyticus]|uniref:Nif3-like dinuclear metal center hexameric protein n=1 Tax=Litorivicinus lipolyticus TaxID=418701 RepID=A0A5Q2Q9L7_9GAMM|nr:Nif3-like dinuclear metal center hexameric protein [Litorivicinus lipolyticus]QGG80968.1 Nif3-like dinuclear metal center hexameric protein [Litorivicinus lipolyticus]
MTPTELETQINAWLAPERFSDYAPNGLQLDSDRPVRTLVSGVTANQALIDAAVDAGADALLVHHGWFWKGESQTLTGLKGRRVRTMLEAGISLLAYHLPLDAHPQLGNNAELARLMGWRSDAPLNPEGIGNLGSCDPISGADMAAALALKLGQAPLWIDARRPIHRLGWCTGAAQSYFQSAIDQGVDAFVTGEISEPMVHLAREAGVHYFAAGHHATERYGVQALGRRLAEQCGLAHQFIEIASPV